MRYGAQTYSRESATSLTAETLPVIRTKKTMKNKILLLTFIISTSSVIAQSKKEIIEILNTRIDSLNIEIKKRDVRYEQEAISCSKNNQTLTS